MDHLPLLLGQFLLPDNESRKHAEEQLKKLAKDPAIVPALLHHLRHAQEPNVRQLSGVLLRKKITGFWVKLPADVRVSVKSVLLESILLEQSVVVRRASADVVSIVAKFTVPSGEWPDLLPFLFQCSQSPQEDHREVALILFTSLTETISEILRPHFATLHMVFLNGLRDQHSNRVRIAALKAVGVLVEWVETEQEVVAFRELVLPILDVARFCLQNGDEDVAIKAFEIFDELLESSAPLLGAAIEPVSQFSLEVGANTSLDINTRYQAVQILCWLARYKPKTMVKHKVVLPVLSVMCRLLAEPEGGVDADEMTASKFASQVLDTMAMSLPKKHVLPPIVAFARGQHQSADPHAREASVLALGVVAEGCQEPMRKRLDDVLPIVLSGLRDPAELVRGSASFALGQFAEHLQPEIMEKYQEVLPAVFDLLGDASAEAQEKAHYALAAFCENLGEEILPYLEPLMGRLLTALSSGTRDLQDICLSAISSAAAAAEGAFKPYVEPVLEACHSFMQLTQDEDLAVRSRATEVVGIVAIAVGKDLAKPFLAPFIQSALQGYELEYSELREYTHGFFANLAELLGEDFAVYLPLVVPHVLQSCSLEDGDVIDWGQSDDEDGPGGGMDNGVSSDEDNDDKLDERRLQNLSIRTGVLDEKASATQALGNFALHTKELFKPYLEETLKVLKKHATYFHEDVRGQSMMALQHVLTATRAAFLEGSVAVDGQTLPIAREVKHVLDIVMEIYVGTLSDADKPTVAEACGCLSHVLRFFDLPTLQKYVQAISDGVLELLKGQAVCQISGDSDGEEGGIGENDEDAEHDDVLMDAATDIMPALAVLLRADYIPLWNQHFEPLMRYARPTRPASDRTMAVATVAEVGKEIGPAIAPYVDIVLPIALRELGDEDPVSRRNAAFCVGILCQHGGERATSSFSNVLMALHPLFKPEEENSVRDNAVSAVARMITASPASLPLPQVLPVLIGALPLTEDQDEAASVYGCICNLLLSSNPAISPMMPQVLHIFGQVMVQEDVAEEVKRSIGACLAQLLQSYREQMEPLLHSLPADQMAATASFMNVQS